MITRETDISLARAFRSDARVIEGWMRGTYVVAGIFAVPSEVVTISNMQRNIPALYAATKDAKRGWWPRGVSGMFLFPFYLSTHFEPEVVAWVQKRQPYRWAIWHEPVLYNIAENAVWMRSDYGRFGSAFYPLVFNLYRRAFALIAERIQKPHPDFINGNPTKTGQA